MLHVFTLSIHNHTVIPRELSILSGLNTYRDGLSVRIVFLHLQMKEQVNL